MSFMFRDRKETEFDYTSSEFSFSNEELAKIRDHYEFLGSYIADKEKELKALYAERKAALFTLRKFGVRV